MEVIPFRILFFPEQEIKIIKPEENMCKRELLNLAVNIFSVSAISFNRRLFLTFPALFCRTCVTLHRFNAAV